MKVLEEAKYVDVEEEADEVKFFFLVHSFISNYLISYIYVNF